MSELRFKISNHAAQRYRERTKGWMAVGTAEEAARLAWERGDRQSIYEGWPEDGFDHREDGDEKFRVYFEGYVYVFGIRNFCDITLITLFPIETQHGRTADRPFP